MLRVLVPLVVLGAAVYALIDCLQTDSARVRSLPKVLWALLIVIAPLLGPIAWVLGGRPPRQSPGTQGGPRRFGPRGPDDDPDFMRKL